MTVELSHAMHKRREAITLSAGTYVCLPDQKYQEFGLQCRCNKKKTSGDVITESSNQQTDKKLFSLPIQQARFVSSL